MNKQQEAEIAYNRLNTMYLVLWGFRRLAHPNFVTPTATQAWLYLMGEIGELTDAISRVHFGTEEHARRVHDNERQNIEKEMGDVIAMALSCMPIEWSWAEKDWDNWDDEIQYEIEQISYLESDYTLEELIFRLYSVGLELQQWRYINNYEYLGNLHKLVWILDQIQIRCKTQDVETCLRDTIISWRNRFAPACGWKWENENEL